MNEIMAGVAGLLLAGFLWWRWRTVRLARQSIGKSVPEAEAGDDVCRVYFFHAEHCAPCRTIKPMIDGMAQEYPNLIQVDVQDDMVLAARFGVRATPSLVAVRSATITAVELGTVSRTWLVAHLTANGEEI